MKRSAALLNLFELMESEEERKMDSGREQDAQTSEKAEKVARRSPRPGIMGNVAIETGLGRQGSLVVSGVLEVSGLGQWWWGGDSPSSVSQASPCDRRVSVTDKCAVGTFLQFHLTL